MYAYLSNRPRVDRIFVHEYPPIEDVKCDPAQQLPALREKDDGGDQTDDANGDEDCEGGDTTSSGDFDRPDTPHTNESPDNATPSPAETPLVTPATEYFAEFGLFPQPQHGCIPPPVACSMPLHTHGCSHSHLHSLGFLPPPCCHPFILPAFEHLPESVTEFAIPVALDDENEVHRRINAFMFGEKMFPFGISLHRRVEGEDEAHTFLNIITPHNWRGLFEGEIRQILADAVNDNSIM